MTKRKNHARLSGLAQTNVYGAFFGALATGVAWYCFNRWGQLEGDFGPELHPLQSTMLKIHGATAMWCVATLGYLIARHIPSGRRQKRNRFTGYITLAWIAAIVITGWMLYYADSSLREDAAAIHWWLGVGIGGVLIIHVIAGLRTRPERALQLRENEQAKEPTNQ